VTSLFLLQAIADEKARRLVFEQEADFRIQNIIKDFGK
jgi:hypothetical protein